MTQTHGPHVQGAVYTYDGKAPRIDPMTYVAPGAHVIGEVTLAPMVSIWFGVVLRGDLAPIEIGEGSNVQDNSVLHIEGAKERAGMPARGVKIGRNVTVGHTCLVHGCTIEDDCLIGMMATVMNGAIIGRGSIVGAGAVVLENMEIPPFSLVVGNPARVKKTYEESVIEQAIRPAAISYQNRVHSYRETFRRIE